ncbi:hypothetical protein [Streptomyces sp. NBC_00370]|uniref:hypothetical protein n=1 Tax=Streptomyces sp. NBC_00370 TaxID=2975728 RepID=UPI002E26E916
MAVHQLPAEIGAFARYLRDLTALLDPGGGWYGVFVQRDPSGMRACLDGAEVPPWDVVDSLLQDYAAVRDADAVGETVRARRLHAVAAATHDRRPGGSAALAERLRLMLHEQASAGARAEELTRALRTARPASAEAERLTHELAWARDDHARASARCAELRVRTAALTTPGRTAAERRPPAPEGWFRGEEPSSRGSGAGTEAPERQGPRWAAADSRAEAQDRSAPEPARPAPEPARAEPARPAPAAPAAKRPAAKRKPRGARFAGIEPEPDTVDEAVPAPAMPLPGAAQQGAAPRGARFGGAPTGPARSAAPVHSDEDRTAVAASVAALTRLRAEGRTGEAHVVLCEAADMPAGRLPLLAAELHRAGLAADWAELLWEAASLPPARLAAVAGALALYGRDSDCALLLRQGAARPADEIADAVVALGDAGREPEAQALLSAFVQSRAPEDAVLVAAGDPHRLVPQLLHAAHAVSDARERDVVHALRVAGIAGV